MKADEKENIRECFKEFFDINILPQWEQNLMENYGINLSMCDEPLKKCMACGEMLPEKNVSHWVIGYDQHGAEMHTDFICRRCFELPEYNERERGDDD